jgi:hypothetical protein
MVDKRSGSTYYFRDKKSPERRGTVAKRDSNFKKAVGDQTDGLFAINPAEIVSREAQNHN